MAVLAYVSAAIVALWGIAHAVPTARVVRDFGSITLDNRRVVVQEWLAEALSMWFIAAVVVVVTSVSGPDVQSARWVYRVAAIMLLAVGVLTTFTGARTRVIWFKICPILLTATAALLVAASLV